MEFLGRYKKYLIVIGVIILIGAVFIGYLLDSGHKEDTNMEKTEELTTTILVQDTFYVDVKGAVKKPGVYEFSNGEMVIDAITKAGGLTKTGNTSNINLSQKLVSEMVVYIFTNNEIKKGSNSFSCKTECKCETIEVNNCYQDTSSSSQTSGKVNINTATSAELTTLSGIGTAIAERIISYRQENAFEQIEDIMKVSGIGESVFAKIKDFITV